MGDPYREYIVMQTSLGKWFDYVDKGDWLFGFALTAVVAVQMALVSAILFWK